MQAVLTQTIDSKKILTKYLSWHRCTGNVFSLIFDKIEAISLPFKIKIDKAVSKFEQLIVI